jgi:flagellar biosynthesis/type III secretory pathway ATPase
VDRAVERQPVLMQFLRQSIAEKWTRERSIAELQKLV